MLFSLILALFFLQSEEIIYHVPIHDIHMLFQNKNQYKPRRFWTAHYEWKKKFIGITPNIKYTHQPIYFTTDDVKKLISYMVEFFELYFIMRKLGAHCILKQFIFICNFKKKYFKIYNYYTLESNKTDWKVYGVCA